MKGHGVKSAPRGWWGTAWRLVVVGVVGLMAVACTGGGDAGDVADEVVTDAAQDAPDEASDDDLDADAGDAGAGENDGADTHDDVDADAGNARADDADESDGADTDDGDDAGEDDGDPYAVPEDPDLAYWQSVVDALFAVDNDQYRLFVAGDGEVTRETEAWVVAVNAPEIVDVILERRATSSLSDEQSLRENFFAYPPGDAVPMVRSVVQDAGYPECVVLEVEKDLSAQFASGTSSRTFWEYITLVPKADGVPNGELNPTPWQYRRRQANDDETQIADFEAERGPLCEP